MKRFILSLFVVLLSSQVVLSDLSEIPDADNDLHIYALPVGQGDCTVIQCPKDSNYGRKGLVTIIDAGRSRLNKKGWDEGKVVQFLNDTTLKSVVLTHSDEDHLNYIDHILSEYKLEGYTKKVNVYHPCQWKSYKESIVNNYISHVEIPKCNGSVDCNIKQPVLSVCPGATLAFVASALGGCRNRRANNDDSIISKITYAGVSTLISGDFEGSSTFSIESFLKTAAGTDIKSDIYRLCHHGAFGEKANTEAFLNAVGAEYVFSSSGLKKSYKHPRCEIYGYYNDRLDDGVVAVHPYTCFFKNGNTYNVNTSKAIYVTSVIREVGGNEIKSYYVIKFDIDSKGQIKAQANHVGDEGLM